MLKQPCLYGIETGLFSYRINYNVYTLNRKILIFNHSGLLTSAAKIISSIEELKAEFVDDTPTAERIQHFSAYLKYTNELKQLCGGVGLVQWIDGSFVTKAATPNDIDVVTFIDFTLISLLGKALQPFKYPASEKTYQVDGYIIAVYPVSSKQYYLYQHDKAYWNDQFTKTRRNKAGHKLSKGFLEIVY